MKIELFADEKGVWRKDVDNKPFGVLWDEMNRVSAYVLDCIDEVDLVVEIELESGHVFELNDKWNGFEMVMDVLSQRLSGFIADWKSQFENLTSDNAIVLWLK